MNSLRFSFVFVATFYLSAFPGASEEYSTSEVVELFEAQMNPGILTRSGLASLRETRRGLVLIPAGSGEAAVTREIDFAVDPHNSINIRISFDFDASSLRSDQKPRLASVCEAMQTMGRASFQVIGHTDAAGSAAHNDVLSVSRAEEVKDFLVEDCRIPETRLRAIGVGERYLFDAKQPLAEMNRRVEFQATLANDG